MSGRQKHSHGPMNRTITHLALSEFHNCQSYMQRLFHAVIDLSPVGCLPEAKKIGPLLIHDLKTFYAEEILSGLEAPKVWETMELRAVRDFFRHTSKTFEGILQMGLFSDYHVAQSTAEIVNILYRHTHKLHLLCSHHTDLDIQLPRLIVAETHHAVGENLPFFSLDGEKLLSFGEAREGTVRSLEWQREKKYESMLTEGHEAIVAKDYNEALEKFERARNFQETAEILTLIGWTYSLIGKLEKAKQFCLKAIANEPHYGPPYNDLGSYLLQEGLLDEALQWFDQAKKATHYQNREYPYINAGRAYMQKRLFPQALEEFAKALALAPHHEELHQTITRLKRTLERSEFKSETSEDPPLF
jgi:Tfp pilus assembly protein PilF